MFRVTSCGLVDRLLVWHKETIHEITLNDTKETPIYRYKVDLECSLLLNEVVNHPIRRF